MSRKQTELLQDVQERIKGLEREAELFRTVLIVKEPGSVVAAQSFEGLRKQIVAGAAERRSHLTQLVSMQVAVSRATSVDDLLPQVAEWLEQAGIAQLTHVPTGSSVAEVFEDLTGEGLDGTIEIVEPAYVDSQTGALLRLGRAQKAAPAPTPVAPARVAPAPVVDTTTPGPTPEGDVTP